MSALTAGYVAGVGVLVGLHVATWGAFKDSPFEGFRPSAFLRSVALAAALSLALAATGGAGDQDPVVLVGLVYALERLATEGWKLFLREDRRQYTIPMRFALRGRPVAARWPRYGFGASAVVALGALCAVVATADPLVPWWGAVAVGSVGGWLTAVGGAWKDAPVEGFSGWKFLRSPTIAGMWALVLLPWTQDLVVLPVAAGGLAVASIETYKTFLTGGRPPGKFAGQPARADDERARERCRFLHSGLHVVCAAAVSTVLLLASSARSVDPERQFALLGILVLSVTLALLVGAPHRYAQQGGRSEPIEPR